MTKLKIQRTSLLSPITILIAIIGMLLGYLLYPQFNYRPNVLGTTTTAKPREYNVFLGSGLNNSSEWQDVPGVQTYLDSTKYGQITTVTFDATIEVPTGNQKVWIRLYNVTDKHPVWYSELSMEGNGPTLLSTSQTLPLGNGNKLYQVQMKSQLKYDAFVRSARIRITGT